MDVMKKYTEIGIEEYNFVLNRLIQKLIDEDNLDCIKMIHKDLESNCTSLELLISAKETLGLSLADCTDGLTEAMTQIIDEYKKAQKKDKEDE